MKDQRQVEKKIKFLKVLNSRTFKFIAARYLQTTPKNLFIKKLQRELSFETKNVVELLKGIPYAKQLRKAGGKRLQKKNPAKFLENLDRILNETLKRTTTNHLHLDNYLEALGTGQPFLTATLILIEGLYPNVYMKLRDEYLKRNAERLIEEGKLLDIKQVQSVLKFIKDDDPPSYLEPLKDQKPIRRTHGNRRQTIYKWIKGERLRAIRLRVNGKNRWFIERDDALLEFSIKEGLKDAKKQIQKWSEGFRFRFLFLSETSVMAYNIFGEPEEPKKGVYIFKLPIWEIFEFVKKGGIEKEIRNRFPNLVYPFTVEVSNDKAKNLEWLGKERIVEAVVISAIMKEWIKFEDRTEWINELQLYLCERVIPFVPFGKINTQEELKKYLRVSARNGMVNRLREIGKIRYTAFDDGQSEELDDLEELLEECEPLKELESVED